MTLDRSAAEPFPAVRRASATAADKQSRGTEVGAAGNGSMLECHHPKSRTARQPAVASKRFPWEWQQRRQCFRAFPDEQFRRQMTPRCPVGAPRGAPGTLIFCFLLRAFFRCILFRPPPRKNPVALAPCVTWRTTRGSLNLNTRRHERGIATRCRKAGAPERGRMEAAGAPAALCPDAARLRAALGLGSPTKSSLPVHNSQPGFPP